MRRILPLIAILLLCAGAMCIALSLGSVAPPHFKSAHAQLSLTGAGRGAPSSGGTPCSVTIEGAGNVGNGLAIVSIGLTTSHLDTVFLDVETNAGPVISVASTTSGGWTTGWTKRATTPGSGSNIIEEWYGVPGTTLSSETITSTVTGTNGQWITAFGVYGLTTNGVFDSNGSIPATAATGNVTGVSTSNAKDVLLNAYRESSISAPTAGNFGSIAGTIIAPNNNFLLSQYASTPGVQSNITVTDSSGGTQNGGIVDALVCQ